MKTIRFFAVDDDIKQVISEVELSAELQYISAIGYPNTVVMRYESGFELPNLGYATHESATSSQSFLVASRSMTVRPREIPLNGGGKAIAIDQLLNPDSVTFTPGGRWKDNIILYGTIGSAHQSAQAIGILKIFERAIKKYFKKIGAFWVGPRAVEELRRGTRLTIAEQSPNSFDLKSP